MSDAPSIKVTRRTVSALLVLGPAALALAPPAAAQAAAKVTFILTNDIYLMGDQVYADGRRRGGFARLAAVVKAERAKGGHVIFAHAGDTISPSLMSGFDRGAHIIALTNMILPDIFVPGNHEYDFGKGIFLTRMGEATFPVYAANLRSPDGLPLPGIRDRSITAVGGIRIGLTGATADDSPRSSSPEDLQFTSTVETVKSQAALLRREGADIVVAVVHANRRQDYQIFESRAADIVLTGDDHDLFVEYDERTAMVESSSDARYVTMIDVTVAVTENGETRDVTWRPVFRVVDTADVEPDPAVAATVARLEQELSLELDVKLGTTAVALDSRGATVRSQESSIGNLVADAMRASTHSDVAITNGGGIRGNRSYPPGAAISRRDILGELPFGNRIVVLELSGRDLRGAIENGLSGAPSPAGRFPQVSGMTVEADVKRPAGARVLAMTVGGAPLDDARRYKVAVNDFMARGGDNYIICRDAKRLLRDYDGPLMANEVMAYVRGLGTVTAGVDGRMLLRQ